MNYINNAQKILGFVQKNKKICLVMENKIINLTTRESQIVSFLAISLRPKQIAYELNISKNTVNSHITNIKQKLACNSAFDIGLILGMFGFYLESKSVV